MESPCPPHELIDRPLWDPVYVARLRMLDEEEKYFLSLRRKDYSEFSQDVIDAKLDSIPSPRHKIKPYWTPEYEARRRVKHPLISPPATPEYEPEPVRPKKRQRDDDELRENTWKRRKQEQATELTPAEIRKAKRKAPRRPRTRSMGTEHVALHPLKRGKVMLWFYCGKYAVMSYAQHWNDYHWEGPRYTPREMKRRYPDTEKSVLDRYGGLDPEDDPYPPQDPDEMPRVKRNIQIEIDKNHKLYAGHWPWRQNAWQGNEGQDNHEK